MALELKGLKAKAVKTGAMFDRLNVAYDKLLDTGASHAADVESLPAQIDGMQDDLAFMVQALGNSVGASEPPPVPEQPKPDANAQAATPASQQPGSTAPSEPAN